MSNYGKTAYNQRNYDQLHLWIPIGTRAKVETAAAAAGESLNRFCARAIEDAIQKETAEVAQLRLKKVQYLDIGD